MAGYTIRILQSREKNLWKQAILRASYVLTIFLETTTKSLHTKKLLNAAREAVAD